MDRYAVVDAHHHYWDPVTNYHPWLRDEPMIPFRYGEYSAIRKPFMPDDYTATVPGRYRVVNSVTVEGEWDPTDPVGETRWIHRVAERYGTPHAHVAQIWLDRDGVEKTMAEQAAFPLVRSVRHKPHSVSRPDRVEPGLPGSMGDPSYRRGYALLQHYDLRFDLQTPWWHLDEALDLAARYPETPIILNHTGLPSDRSPSGLDGWRRAMRRFATFPEASVKISGLGLPATPWRLDDNRRIIRDTIEIFGVGRCMFASNFPVDSLVADFGTIFDGFMEAVRDTTPTEKRKLFHDNALRTYRISA